MALTFLSLKCAQLPNLLLRVPRPGEQVRRAGIGDILAAGAADGGDRHFAQQAALDDGDGVGAGFFPVADDALVQVSLSKYINWSRWASVRLMGGRRSTRCRPVRRARCRRCSAAGGAVRTGSRRSPARRSSACAVDPAPRAVRAICAGHLRRHRVVAERPGSASVDIQVGRVAGHGGSRPAFPGLPGCRSPYMVIVQF